ncbi:MAG: type II toxin-antitoxin system prevent-host-death family antitoxin [Trueperaceae bacterium]|nr:type II toxin-antitoxin system prevent-host-death family antitoxin [Trueperaceae bacterium]
MAKIGVRELRQNASVYLARVQEGEVIEVTSRGRTVARIVPPTESLWDKMMADGHIRPPLEGAPRLEDIEPAPPVSGFNASEVLRQMREHER